MNIILDLVLLSLASARITICLSTEKIFLPLREWIWARSAPAHSKNSDGYLYSSFFLQKFRKPDAVWYKFWRRKNTLLYSNKPLVDEAGETIGIANREPGFFGQVIECLWCLGFWVTLGLWFSYNLFNDAMIVITMFALWGVQTIINHIVLN